MNFNHIKREFAALRYEWKLTAERYKTDKGIKEYSDTTQQFVTDVFRQLPYTLAHVFTVSAIGGLVAVVL